MLRALLIFLSKASWAQKFITNWSFSWRLASRFISGETINDALRVIKELNSQNISATLDFLGENTTSVEDAQKCVEEILKIISEIDNNNLSSNVSVKLSQIGLGISEDVCRQNIKTILEKAREHRNFVRIDMEDSGICEKTINVYRWARENGFDNVGIAIQSYLYRSLEDIEVLGQYPTPVRLIKGAYKEPASVAFQKKDDVDRKFDEISERLIAQVIQAGVPVISEDGRFPPIPAVASHDEARIDYMKALVEKENLPYKAVEFQMLHGIRRDLQLQLSKEGYPVRVYVPYGTHWYPYFMRRLAERPANLWFFIGNFFKK